MPLVYLVLAGFRTGKMPGKRCIALTPDRIRIIWANPIRLTPGAINGNQICIKIVYDNVFKRISRKGR